MNMIDCLTGDYFNSQPHKEADVDWKPLCQARSISTHSLTRRLTIKSQKQLCRTLNFNSQPHKEADLEQQAAIQKSLYFNSQPHKEADYKPVLKDLKKNIFQLTASQGG